MTTRPDGGGDKRIRTCDISHTSSTVSTQIYLNVKAHSSQIFSGIHSGIVRFTVYLAIKGQHSSYSYDAVLT